MSSEKDNVIEPNAAVVEMAQLLPTVVGGSTDVLSHVDALLSQIRSVSTASELGARVITVLRQMVRSETGISNIDLGLPRLVERLWAGPVISELIESLYRNARRFLSDESDVAPGLIHSVSIDLRELIDWYALRRATFSRQKSGSILGESDQLIDVQVFHDTMSQGVAGAEVRLAACLMARAHQLCWVRVNVALRDESVSPQAADTDLVVTAPGWELWSDRTDSIVAMGHLKAPPFAALVPVKARGQQAICEEISLFVPYAALNISSGVHTVALRVALIDPEGRELDVVTVSERWSLPDPVAEPVSAQLSPQALCLWPSDVGNGDLLSPLLMGFRRAEGRMTVSFDCGLWGKRGKRVRVVTRVLNEHGAPIKAVTPRGDAELGAYEHELILLPQHSIARFLGLELEIPLAALDLPRGRHKLLAELTLVDDQERPICGRIEPCVVDHQGVNLLTAIAERTATQPRAIADSVLEIRSIAIDRSHWFNGERHLGLFLDLVAPAWDSTLARLEVRLETLQGDLLSEHLVAPELDLCERSFFLGLELGRRESMRTVLVTFPWKVLAALGRADDPPGAIVVRAELFSSDDLLVSTVTKVVDLVSADFIGGAVARKGDRTLLSTRRPVMALSSRVANLDPRRGASLELFLALDRSVAGSERFFVYYEFIDSAGRLMYDSARLADDDLPGTVMSAEIPCARAFAQSRVFQSSLLFEVNWSDRAGRSPSALNLLLFSKTGEFLQRWTQSLNIVSGVGAGEMRPQSPEPRVEQRDGQTGASQGIDGVNSSWSDRVKALFR